MEEKVTYPVRINRYLALQNICSRREADQFIKDGKIMLSGKLAKIGDKVNEKDKVEIIKDLGKQYAYLAYNKARGIITHSPQKKEKSIEDVVKFSPRVFPVGRLDKDSHGLIILTNDGRITGKLLDPEYGHEREYVVKIDKEMSPAFLKKMSEGVELDDGYVTRKSTTKKIEEDIFSITLTEGKKHQIRRMCQQLGYEVRDLKRVRIMNIVLKNTLAGQYRKIEGVELEKFLSELGLNRI